MVGPLIHGPLSLFFPFPFLSFLQEYGGEEKKGTRSARLTCRTPPLPPLLSFFFFLRGIRGRDGMISKPRHSSALHLQLGAISFFFFFSFLPFLPR